MYRDYNSNDLTTIVKDLTLDFESPCTQTITNTPVGGVVEWLVFKWTKNVEFAEVWQKIYNLMLMMFCA